VGDRIYQASFVGYFPAENPLYTCIVVINSPSNGVYYGAAVAGPVFKEIAEKVYSSSLNCITPVNHSKDLLTQAPGVITGRSDELTLVAKKLNVPVKTSTTGGYVHRMKADTLQVALGSVNLESQLKKGIMPNLSGLSAKDALYLLENHGMSVKIQGFGCVKEQSIEPGQKFSKGNRITLILS
jgi:cell division protein FtsI (penicillin-binding protein 3)